MHALPTTNNLIVADPGTVIDVFPSPADAALGDRPERFVRLDERQISTGDPRHVWLSLDDRGVWSEPDVRFGYRVVASPNRR